MIIEHNMEIYGQMKMIFIKIKRKKNNINKFKEDSNIN